MNFINKIKNINVSDEYEKGKQLVMTFRKSYTETYSHKIKLIDSFIVFAFLILCVQMVYVILNGLDPMNSFLAGVVSCVGTITLLISLRFHVNPKTKLKEYANEKVYSEFLISGIILFFVCINFLG